MPASIQGAVDFLQQLNEGDTVLIVAHCRPDGDAVGSVIAMYHALKLRGIDAHPLLADNVSAPRGYLWLDGVKAYISPTKAKKLPKIDAIIVMDSPEPKRLSAAAPIVAACANTLLIDHHPSNGDLFTSVACVDTTACATAEMVWRILRAADFEVSPAVATACFVAILTDTGRFQFNNTTARALRTAAELLEEGAPLNEVNIHLYSSKSAALLALESTVLANMQVLQGGKVVVSHLTQENYATTGAKKEEAENIIDTIRVLDGCEVCVLVTFGATGTRVSLRSKRDFNVAEVAMTFGGGGHKAAAGVTWPDGSASLDDIVEALLPLLPSASN